jgi:SAM-dependent methyltransferase
VNRNAPSPPAGHDRHDPYDLDAGTREHYQDAALYDFEYRRRRADVNHYRALARRADPGPLLELGCGTGRVLVPLARDGHQVVGIDVARSMLARAAGRAAKLPRAARARIALAAADMRALPFARARFALVVAPFNAFQHLYTRTDVAACLDEVRRVLQPGGRFAFDVLNPDLGWLTRDPRRRWARTRFKHPATGVRYEYSTNQTYDPVTQIAYMRIYYRALDVPAGKERTQVIRLAHRQFFPAELEALLHASGFRVLERWGGFDGQRFAGDSEAQVIICAPHK